MFTILENITNKMINILDVTNEGKIIFNQTERDKVGGLTWNNQLENARIIYDIIINKFLQ